MSSVKDTEVLWYALGSTSPRHELKIRDDARRYGLDAFVPLKYEVKKVRGREQRLLVPAVTQIVLVKGTLDAVNDYIEHAHLAVFIKRSTYSNHKDYLTVSLHAMENFMAVTEMTERRVTYFRPEEISLREGDQIRIRGGFYDGREGVIMRIKGKRNKHLVAQIPGILIAAVELSPEMIELMQGTDPEPVDGAQGRLQARPRKALVAKTRKEVRKPVESKSKDLDKDRKLLFELTHRLLFEFSDKYHNENEYYLLRSEVERTQGRIASFRGYTAATEAELALPLYMASVILEDGQDEAEARLRKAVAALKDNSLLKVRCQMYLAILAKDSALKEALESLLGSWRQAPLSAKQRDILEEYSQLRERP